VGRAREQRILDAAGELLLTFGYRRVTVDDVARRAGVGKGTVYLHWSSKLELFAAVLLRDVASIVEAQLAAMRADPAEISCTGPCARCSCWSCAGRWPGRSTPATPSCSAR
jgi:AcrR family transcriptional regulator